MARAVLYVKDLAEMEAFYATCFAMSRLQSDEGVCVLSSEQWELTLVRVPPSVAATIVISVPPQRRAASPIKLCFEVAGIEAAAAVIAAAGGHVDASESVFAFRGSRHRDFLDPEGNVAQLRQRISP